MKTPCYCQNCFNPIAYGRLCADCRADLRTVEFSQEARAVRLLNAAKCNAARNISNRVGGRS